VTRDRLEDLLRRHGPWVVALLLLGVGAAYLNRAALRPDSGERGDTRFYQRAADRYWSGADLYYDRRHGDPRTDAVPTTGYTYLPPFAAASGWTIPLPYRALRALWLLLMLACAVGATLAATRVAAPTVRPRVTALLALLLVLRFGLNDLAHGQVNWLLTLLLGLALLDAQRDREIRAGLWLGAALLIKPTAWLLVPWYAITRRWRLCGACLGLFLGALGLAGLRYGPASYATQLGDWYLRMSRFAGEAALTPDNASLASALSRLSGDLIWPRWVAVGVVGAAFGLLVWKRRASPAAPAAVIALGALLSPVTWKAHLVALLLPATFLGRRLAEQPAGLAPWLGFAALWSALTLPAHHLLAADAFEAAGALTLSVAALAAWVTACPHMAGPSESD
jgi:hypothetical protein